MAENKWELVSRMKISYEVGQELAARAEELRKPNQRMTVVEAQIIDDALRFYFAKHKRKRGEKP